MHYLIATLSQDQLQHCILQEVPFIHEGKRFQLLTSRHDERVYAWLNRCPHWGIPLGMRAPCSLNEQEPRLECGTHRAIFRLQDGECLQGPCLGEFLTPVPVVEALGHLFYYLPRRMRIL